MVETLFTFDRHNYRQGQQDFRGKNLQEYYAGDFSIPDMGMIDVRSDRKLAGRLAIINQRSRGNLHFRRTWKHIQQDATDLTILWFVRYGTMVLGDGRNRVTARPGDFVLTRSTSPLDVACWVDGDAVHEVLHATVPTHVLQNYLAYDLDFGVLKPKMRNEYAICGDILTSIFEDEGRLPDDTLGLLAETTLRLVGIALSEQREGAQAKMTIRDRRLRDVLRFIEIHLADPMLSHPKVAKACGISARYLTHLLASQGTNFRTLVWKSRLEKAKSWLSDSDPRDIAISEIAFALGFKSTAHFSRIFKQTFHMNPRDLRRVVPSANAAIASDRPLSVRRVNT